MQILVLEDELFVGLHLEEELQSQGHAVLGPAGSIREAQTHLSQATIDFAILDVNVNGEMPTAIAEELIRKAIPFIYLSGYDEAYIRAKLPAAPSLQKPVRMDALTALMQELTGAAASSTN